MANHIQKIQVAVFHEDGHAQWPDCSVMAPGWYYSLLPDPLDKPMMPEDCTGPFMTYAAAISEASAAVDEVRPFLEDPKKGS